MTGIVTKALSHSNHDNHPGIDIATNFNANVEAANDGFVIFSGSHEDYGNTIIISHPNNYYTLYSHLNILKVGSREYIKKGQLIGHVGESG